MKTTKELDDEADLDFDLNLKTLYELGSSIQELANRYDFSYTGMRYRLLRVGTVLRAKNGKQKVKRNVSSD